MRVIAGEFRSRLLKTPPGDGTRPTPDRLREALFSILTTVIDGAVFADVYAGSGAVGIEALSRGASRAVFIERGRTAARVIHENLNALGLGGRARVIHGAAVSHLPLDEADIIFLDPPYALEAEYERVLDKLAASPALIIIQHASRFKLPESHGGLRRTRQVKQGDNSLSFYRAEPCDNCEFR
ncbi:MAG: 16S rRNA (guanine(966)-N(2))-methyltransferase RsmD [Acidobacteria bacterium]|nr:16S rRNA (guanine(966)-N(2))-methyltransferase RsmD [Acidobacteriota bacterium]